METLDELLVRRVQELPAYRLLPPAGAQLAVKMTLSEPTKTVGQGALTSVSGEFPSSKLRKLVQFDSRTHELVFVLLAELDQRVAFVLDQPERLIVSAHDSKGRRSRRYITPDYAVFCSDRFYFVEVKPLSEIQEKASIYPKDWVINERGRWTFRPGELAAAELGYGFEVFIPDDYSPTFKANLIYRLQVREAEPIPMSTATIATLKRRLSQGPMTVGSLCTSYSSITGSQLQIAVERGELYGLFDRQLFDGDFIIFGTAAELEKHVQVIDSLQPADTPVGPIHTRLLRASRTELDSAHRRMQKYDDARRMELPLKATDYRIAANLRAAAEEGSPRLAAFVPDFQSRGGKGQPIEDFVKDSIKKALETYVPKEMGLPSASKAMAQWHQANPSMKGLCSWESFRKIFSGLYAPERLALMTGGKRAFHQQRPPVDGRKKASIPQIAGLYAHVDGVYSDAYTCEDENREFLRPIYYPIVDEVTQYVIARGVKVGKPSSLAYAMALRDCVARHGAIPAVITTDRGSEFINHMGRDAGAHICCTMQRRPSGAPRYGGMGESFNACISRYLQTLAGGTCYDKAGRSADGNKKGRRTAAYELEELVRRIDHWIFEVWNKSCASGELETREEKFQNSLKFFPDAVRKPPDTSAFRYYSSYPIRARKLDYTVGCRFGGKAYSSDELTRSIRLRHKLTEPRLDSFDPSTIWLRDESSFIACYSRDHNAIAGMDLGLRLKHFEHRLAFHRRAKASQQDTRELELIEPISWAHSASNSASSSTQAPVDEPAPPANKVPAGAAARDKDPWKVERVPIRRLGDIKK